MKFNMDAADLKYLMNVCKLSIDKHGVRPSLEMIHCKLIQNQITATSLDGYRIHSVTVPCDHAGEGHEFLIPVVKVPPKVKSVIVEILDEEVIYDFLTEKQVLKINQGKFPKVDNFLPKSEDMVFEISVDPKYLKDAMEAFKTEKVVTLQFHGEVNPIMVKSSTNDFAMVLPVRKQK